MTIPSNVDTVSEYRAQMSGGNYISQWDQVSGLFGVKPGDVFLEDFDLGVVKTMGAFLDPHGNVDESSLVLPVTGLKPEYQRSLNDGTIVVPVTFGHPEAYMNIWTLPGIFVRREGAIEPDMARYSQELESYRAVAPQAQTVEGQVLMDPVTGPAETIQGQRAEAYILYYMIDLIARYRTDANALLRAVLPRFKQNKAILVRDSDGDLNEYSAFLDSIDSIDEILGVTMKHVGYSLTLRVLAELSLGPTEPEIRKTAQTIEIGTGAKDPSDISESTKSIQGLPLKTYPSRVLGRICSHVSK